MSFRKILFILWAIFCVVFVWYLSPINKSTGPETAEQAIEEYLKFSKNPLVMANRYLETKMDVTSQGTRLLEGKEYEVFDIGYTAKEEDGNEARYVRCATVLWNSTEKELLEDSLIEGELIDAMPWR